MRGHIGKASKVLFYPSPIIAELGCYWVPMKMHVGQSCWSFADVKVAFVESKLWQLSGSSLTASQKLCHSLDFFGHSYELAE